MLVYSFYATPSNQSADNISQYIKRPACADLHFLQYHPTRRGKRVQYRLSQSGNRRLHRDHLTRLDLPKNYINEQCILRIYDAEL
jgi:hypothetical protein